MGKSRKGGVRVKQVGGGGGNAKMPPMLSPEDLQSMMNPADLEQQHQDLLPATILDRNFKMIWPLSESFTMKNIDTFYVIYPNYMDACKSTGHGRKIAVAKAVPHDGHSPPNVSDISCVLQELRIRHVIEGYKGYSKDTACHFENLGRVRYDPHFTLPSTSLMSPTADDDDNTSGGTSTWRKRRLLEIVAELIPLLPSRIERVRRETEERNQRAAARAATATAAQQQQLQLKSTSQQVAGGGSGNNATSSSSTNAKKNKGKKGKRKV
jgi:signal recognition particle subunit SEC65